MRSRPARARPDVAEVEFDELPSFEVTHNVVNLVPYGANKYKSDFVPWAWNEVSQGSAVYAMPGDAGPMAFYYNSKLLAKYHIAPPTTWAQFATAAAALKKADPSAFITNFSATDLQWVMSLMAQDNAWPFAYSGGSKVTINWTGPAQMQFAAYWQKLIAAKEVNGTTDVSATSFADMDKGIDASWLSSAWGPSYFAPDAKSSVGDWRAAPLPQWTAGAERGRQLGRLDLPGVHPERQQGRGGRVLRVAERDHRVVEHHQDGPVVAVPDVPARCSTTRRTRTSPSRCPGPRTRTRPSPRRRAASRAFLAAVHDRGADPVRHRVRRRARWQGDAAAAFKNFQNVLVTYAKAQGFTVSG